MTTDHDNLESHALHQLRLLEHVDNSPRLSNRVAADKLGVSIKLAHAILKRMVAKGLLHINVVHARRWDYFLTPKGIAEKTRLTLEFFDFSMCFYREARRRSAQVCRDLAELGMREVILLGANDLAEIVYLGVQEWSLTVVGVYDDDAQETFMTLPVRPLSALSAGNPRFSTPVIVCLYDACQPMQGRYLPSGIDATPQMHWIFGEDLTTNLH